MKHTSLIRQGRQLTRGQILSCIGFLLIILSLGSFGVSTFFEINPNLKPMSPPSIGNGPATTDGPSPTTIPSPISTTTHSLSPTPIHNPSPAPTATLVNTPTPAPNDTPTPTPNDTPTPAPTDTPTAIPTDTPTPTPAPTDTPTAIPTDTPTPTPTKTPSPGPSPTHTPTPRPKPTPTPTHIAIHYPTPTPTPTHIAIHYPTPTHAPKPTPTPTQTLLENQIVSDTVLSNIKLVAAWPTMTVGQSVDITVSLVPKPYLKDQLTTTARVENNPTQVVSYLTPIGTPGVPIKNVFGPGYDVYAMASLFGAAFDIQSIEPRKQSLIQHIVSFHWIILPKEVGLQTIEVTLVGQWNPKARFKESEEESDN